MKPMKEHLQAAIQGQEIRDLSALSADYACVALILHPSPSSGDLDIAVIRRAEVETDPWAGHLALPGGRREAGDPNDVFAAAREAREEIGIELHPGTAIGRIDDVQARRDGMLFKFFLRPVVFLVAEKGRENLDPHEVAELYWIPLSHFLDPANHLTFVWERDERKVDLPGIRVPNGRIFWGLSYIVMTDFVRRLARARVDDQFPALGQLSDLSHWK